MQMLKKQRLCCISEFFFLCKITELFCIEISACVFVCVCACVFSQTLRVCIINVEEYEKQENFFIVLDDPKWLKRGLSCECVIISDFIFNVKVTSHDSVT